MPIYPRKHQWSGKCNHIHIKNQILQTWKMSVSVHAKLPQTGLYIYDVYIYSFIHISYLHEVLELALISIFVNKMCVTDIHCPNQKEIDDDDNNQSLSVVSDRSICKSIKTWVTLKSLNSFFRPVLVIDITMSSIIIFIQNCIFFRFLFFIRSKPKVKLFSFIKQ